jgi:imidazolonepropionase-like amidohydrolase
VSAFSTSSERKCPDFLLFLDVLIMRTIYFVLRTLTVAVCTLICTISVAGQDLLIRNGTVLTVTGGTLENTDILVRNGRIAEIGAGLSGSGLETIDAAGLYVMPGIIDAHSHIAVSSINEATAPATPEVNVGDVLEPYDIRLYRALAGGVTISQLMHGSANVIGGQCETVKHRYGVHDPDSLRMQGAPRTIKFALGENPTRVHGNRGSSSDDVSLVPRTRMGVEFVIRESFNKALRYMDAWEDYEAGRTADSRLTPPPYSGRLEVLADILRGEIIVHSHSYRADEILMLLDVLEDFGVDRIVFQHVNEGFKVAPELAAYGAMASVFSDWWAYKFEVYYSTAYNAAILTRNGVVTSINSDSPELNRHLYHEAAKSQRYGGLSDDEALALITINPARQLGIEDRAGSIEVGKDADLAIFSAHPLSIYAVPQKTIIDGEVRFDVDEDPDDMRLLVDPLEEIDAAVFSENGHTHQCLDGAFFDAAATENL